MNIRLPAEWEQHEATWLIWPKKHDDWPGKFNVIKWAYIELIKYISKSEIIRLIVDDVGTEERVRYYLNKSHIDPGRIEFYHITTDRSWIRDTGPFYCTEDKEMRAVCFSFNGWGKYSDYLKDKEIASQIVNKLGYEFICAVENNKKVVLEGGSIDVNGEGTLLTTEQCLLDSNKQTRNEGFDYSVYESVFKKYFGVTNVVWLRDGISGDDTNGHIDDFCRFVNRNTVVMCEETNTSDPNYKILRENKEIITVARLQDGSSFEVVMLPMPEPVYFDNQRLPASYANFYIANSYVLVPTFNDPNDYKALGLMRDLFKDRTVVGINCTDLILGLGSIHCLTKEQTALPPS